MKENGKGSDESDRNLTTDAQQSAAHSSEITDNGRAQDNGPATSHCTPASCESLPRIVSIKGAFVPPVYLREQGAEAEGDELDDYGQYVAAVLQSMDRRTRACVKREFGEVLFRVETYRRFPEAEVLVQRAGNRGPPNQPRPRPPPPPPPLPKPSLTTAANTRKVPCNARDNVKSSGECKKKRVQKPKRWWVKPRNDRQQRCNSSDSTRDLNEESSEKIPSSVRENFFQMSAVDFEILLSRIGPLVAKQDTIMRKSIFVRDKLVAALRYFATGDSFSSLSSSLPISRQVISSAVCDICKAIAQEFREELKLPENEEQWLNIAGQFENQWDFPNCLGAVGAKHVLIQSKIGSPTEISEDTGDCLLLLALVDACHCFTFVDVECYGYSSDAGVVYKSSFFSKLETGELKLPPDAQLPSSDKALPYVFLGDHAFALDRHLMRPYRQEGRSDQEIFNHRLSRARGVAETAFGILASAFGVLRKPIPLEPEKASAIALACVLLHNFLCRSPTSASFYTAAGSFDVEMDGLGSWRGMTSFVSPKETDRKSSEGADAVRNSFAEHFATSGPLV